MILHEDQRNMYDIEPPVIYGLEHQCRALSTHHVYDDMSCRFVVGTQSLRSENLVYIFEYTDETNNLTKMAFRHTQGEIWHLACSYKNPELLTTVHNMPGSNSKISVFKFPYDVTGALADDDNIPALELFVEAEVVESSSSKAGQGLTQQCLWHPEDGTRIVYCNDGEVIIWNVETQQPEFTNTFVRDSVAQTQSQDSNSKRHSVGTLRWSPNCNCNIIAASLGPHVIGVDTRQSSGSKSWNISNAHNHCVRSIDFNPNSQYYLVTGGDDCKTNFWDLRNLKDPSLTLKNHSHWVWSVRYNPYHDQLVLTAGSDYRATLNRVQSIASDPFGHMNMGEMDAEGDTDGNTDDDLTPVDKIEQSGGPQGDTVINVYDDHDDAVYAAEWGTDPWIFATLGFESRLVFNKVPKQEKFNILF